MTANEINALVDRLREQRNLSDAEFKTILETDAMTRRCKRPQTRCVARTTARTCTCADSLNLRITAKITVTIVASVGITETRRVTV